MKQAAVKLLKTLRLYNPLHRTYRAYLENKWQQNYPQARREVIKNYSEKRKYINIGGGRFLKQDWRIMDYISPQYPYDKDLIDYNINLLDKSTWPIENNSFDLAYTSHCLEHLTDAAGKHTFSETYRILKPGGIFRITVPDADLAYNAYLEEDLDFFINESNARDKSTLLSQFLDFFTCYTQKDIDKETFDKDIKSMSKTGFLNKYIPAAIDPGTHDFSAHITWYNFEKIEAYGKESGFSKIILSNKRGSVSEEMRNPEFDHKPFRSSVYVDLVK